MTAGTLIRNARSAAGVTQRELAARSNHLQPAISRIERKGGASFRTVEELLGVLGLRLIAVPQGGLSVADYASEIRDRLAQGLPVTRVLVEATNTLVDAGPHERALLVASPPPLTGTPWIDAFLAGLVDHLCGPDGPRWTDEPARFTAVGRVLNPFPDDEVLEGLIRAATPPAFARHGIHVDLADLTSV